MQPLTLTWPGGEHRFALRIGELRGLQEARDAGPEEILNRLRAGTWRADDLIQPIRWGLVGGEGMRADEAARRVMEVFDLHPKAQFKLTAISILFHSMLGPEDDDVGKPEGAETTAPESGASAGSTETGQ